MSHYSLLPPSKNRKSEQLTVMATFGSKQISFVRREIQDCTVPARDFHIGWNGCEKIRGVGFPAPFTSAYEEEHLQSHLSEMGDHPDNQRRQIPMATVPKSGLICLTSFTDEKFSGPEQGASSSAGVFKTKLLTVGNAGIHPVRSTSCQLVRDQFRRDLQKGQKIMRANERLDNLHAQITKQVGEGTRQLQERILDYVDKISPCFTKNNLYTLENPKCLTPTESVKLTTMDKSEKIEEKETRCGLLREKKKQRQNREKRKERNQEIVRKPKKREDEAGKKGKTETGDSKKRNEANVTEMSEKVVNGEVRGAKKDTKNESESLSYQFQTSPCSQQEFGQDKDNQILPTFLETRDSRMEGDFQYPIDSDSSAAKSSRHIGRLSPPSTAANPGTERETPTITSRRMTWPNINLNFSSSSVRSLHS